MMEGYYTRSRVTRTSRSKYTSWGGNTPGPSYEGTPSMGQRRTLSWRTAPSSDDVYVPDYIADPYAHFLRFDPAAYREAFKSRGIEPGRFLRFDEGHAYSDVRHSIIAGNSVDLMYGSIPEYSWVQAQHRNTLLYCDDGGDAPFRSVGVDLPVPPVSNLHNFAQKAISKTAPSHTAFDLARFLGELREGIPQAVGSILTFKSRTDFFRSLGSEYLNAKFGWENLIADLMALVNVLTNSSEILMNFPAFGKPVRRHYRIAPFTTSIYQSNRPVSWSLKARGTDEGPNISGSVGGELTGSLTKSMTTSYNFSGAYTKFLPVGFDATNYFSRVSTLTNTRLTPRALWELSPWTWLIDWALDIKSTISSNMLADDESLFIHYAYASYTATLQSRSEFRLTPIGSNSNAVWARGTASPTLVSTTWKTRVRANPYGFTVGGLDGLSAGQAAILAALGMSRLR